MTTTRAVTVEGHLIDSLTLAKILDLIVESGADHHLTEVRIGRTAADVSRARIEITADEEVLDRLMERLTAQGVTDAGSLPEPMAGVVGEPAPLSWGRRYLMCPPHHYGVLYEINPWMHAEVAVDPQLATEQWQGLVDTLRAAGAEVVVIEPDPSVPDMVFTANAGVVNGRQFVPSHFRHAERQAETAIFAAWFADNGFVVDHLPADLGHEGAGDALPFGDVLLSGYRFRSDLPAATELSRLTGAPVRPIELVDERLYHIDITFCPLDGRRALCAPTGWDRYARRVVEALVPEPLWLTDEEAFSFCANSVVVDRTVVMPATPVRVGRQLERWGFDVVTCDVGEFLKAGGGCRCLTLSLDTTLAGGRAAPRSAG